MRKDERFKQDFQEFLNKDTLTIDDYMKMFVTVYSVTKQGDGLGFTQIKSYMEEILEHHKK